MLDRIGEAGSAPRGSQERFAAGSARLAESLAPRREIEPPATLSPSSLSIDDHPKSPRTPEEAVAEVLQAKSDARAQIALVRSYDRTLGTILDLFG